MTTKGQPLDPHPALMPRCTCGELPEIHKPVRRDGEIKYGPCTSGKGADGQPCGCRGYQPEVAHA